MSRVQKTRQAMFGTIAFFNPRCFINTAVKLELWRKTYKSVALYSLDTSDLRASDMRSVEAIQNQALRSVMRLTKRAKISSMRVLAGIPSMSSEVWRLRLGVLQGIMTKHSIVRDICLFVLHMGMENSWTYKSMVKLMDLISEMTKPGTVEVSPFAMMMSGRENYKENVKLMVRAREHRDLVRDIEKHEIYRVPVNPFKDPMPLMVSDFSYKHRDM